MEVVTKKRGRPKKSEAAPLSEDDEPQKKRGRPKKESKNKPKRKGRSKKIRPEIKNEPNRQSRPKRTKTLKVEKDNEIVTTRKRSKKKVDEEPAFQAVFVKEINTSKFRSEKEKNCKKNFLEETLGIVEESEEVEETIKQAEEDQVKKKEKNVPKKTGRKRVRRSVTASEAEKEEENKQEEEKQEEKCIAPVIKKKPVVKKQVEDVKVKCGKCELEINKKLFHKHDLMEHNGLGWIDGEEKPDYENDEKLLKKILFAMIKERKGSLICESCRESKRSVLGYISHVKFCGKNEEERKALMYVCPICQAVMMPSSMEHHERTHRLPKERAKETSSEPLVTEDGQRIKRKAAEKAVTKLQEFTSLEKEEESEKPHKPLKQEKLNTSGMKQIIQRPQLTKRIPGPLKNMWLKAINSGNEAKCNQPGCKFSAGDLNDIVQHYSLCNFVPKENFLCKICKYETKDEADILEHTKTEHILEDFDENNQLEESSDSSDSSSENDEPSDFKDPKVSKPITHRKLNESTVIKKFEYLAKLPLSSNHWSMPFPAAFEWNLKFEQENYSSDLFPEYPPNSFVLIKDKDEKQSYLPKLHESMTLKSSNDPDADFIKFKLFEGQRIDEVPTFFTGGPVWALAWLPLPTSMAFSSVSQFLAVSCHPSMEIEYSVGRSYAGKNLIQLWQMNLNDEKFKPKLAYALIHKAGTVWSLEWCPSGCYQSEKNSHDGVNRIGLLAAGCSDGCIYIYSMACPEDLRKKEKEESAHLIYRTNPVLTLIVNIKMLDNNCQNWQVNKISWTKEKGHDFIAAGFSNGYIGLWNLNAKSPLIKIKRPSTTYLQPCKHFYAHGHAVNMVNLVPLGGKRYLASASFDRTFKFWDLEDTSQPKISNTRSFVTDGAWLNNWQCAILAYDDALSLTKSFSYIAPLREFAYKDVSYSMLPTNSPSYTVSASDFGNSIAQGTLGGEILVIFPQQMLYSLNMYKALPKKRSKSLFSKVKTIKLKESEDFIPMTYEECKDNVAISFCDNLENFDVDKLSKGTISKRTLTTDLLNCPPVEQYPYMSVNKLSWNPNSSSFLWLSAGYQNGLVRLVNFQSMAQYFNIN